MSATDSTQYEEILIESTVDKSRTIDLRVGVQSIDYYEDVFSPTITAKILVTTTGSVIDNTGEVIAKSARPVSMPYQSTTTLLLQSFASFPWRMIGLQGGEDVVTVQVPLMNDYHEPSISDIHRCGTIPLLSLLSYII